MDITNLNIVMLMFQPSVVARGLEKKLDELNNNVTTIIGDFGAIDTCIDGTDLFVFNLPTTIADDAKELKVLVQVGDKISDKGKSMLIVGEKELWEELVKVYKGISQYEWVFRPVNTDDLCEAAEKALTKKKAKKPGAATRILIVDDDPSYAKMVREWIKDKYKVDIVTAGMQAISFLMKLPQGDGVDLILLDYEMPIVDGPQVFQMLRSEPTTAGIPVVFLTGVGTREGVTRVMSLHPDGYILKSTSREDLIESVEKTLKKSQEAEA